MVATRPLATKATPPGVTPESGPLVRSWTLPGLAGLSHSDGAVRAFTAFATLVVWITSATLLLACSATGNEPAATQPAGTPTAPPAATAPPAESRNDDSPATPTAPVAEAMSSATGRRSEESTPAHPQAARATPATPAATAAPGTPVAPNTPEATTTPGTQAATATPNIVTPTPTGESGAQRTGRPRPITRGPDSADTGSTPVPATEGEQLYTWQDGEHTRQVWLQPAQDSEASGEGGISGRADSRSASDDAPVFRDDSGRRMTLPGGVLLVLDPEWDESQVDDFFAANGIAPGRVEKEDFATNAYFISTDPGLPSLLLANELADEEGVLISSPNWSSQVVLR